jgi:hypothetical protein
MGIILGQTLDYRAIKKSIKYFEILKNYVMNPLKSYAKNPDCKMTFKNIF